MAELNKFSLRVGDAAPPFSLPGTDGKTHALSDFDGIPYLLVAFWCNHCPYVQAWEGRMIEIGRKYPKRELGVVLINSNDATAYPDDDVPSMVRRATSRGYPFPYLRDESQAVAHAYGALVTPHPMLFDAERRLVFQGRIDDQHDHPEQVRHHYLTDAIDAALSGRPIGAPEVSVLGCSVKWKS